MSHLNHELSEYFMECARYGELDEVIKILKSEDVDVDYKSGIGENTAMHMAAGNGHFEIVEHLCLNNAKHLPNKSGNYPLHWAIQRNQVESVRVILKSFPHKDQMNVLAKNEFGISSISEAFKVENPEIIKLIMDHSSVEQDMKRQQEKTNGCESPSNHPTNEMSEITHCLFLSRSNEQPIEISEIGMEKNVSPLGSSSDPSTDTTGFYIWGASIVMSRWLVNDSNIINEHDSVLELGAGCGTIGISLSTHKKPRKVTLTDINKLTLENLKRNVAKNSDAANISVEYLNWCDERSFPDEKFDVLIGCDIIYGEEFVDDIFNVVNKLLTAKGKFLICYPNSNRFGIQKFTEKTLRKGSFLRLKTEEIAPENLKGNPFAFDQLAVDATLTAKMLCHFPELVEVEYKLLCFEKLTNF